MPQCHTGMVPSGQCPQPALGCDLMSGKSCELQMTQQNYKLVCNPAAWVSLEEQSSFWEILHVISSCPDESGTAGKGTNDLRLNVTAGDCPVSLLQCHTVRGIKTQRSAHGKQL